MQQFKILYLLAFLQLQACQGQPTKVTATESQPAIEDISAEVEREAPVVRTGNTIRERFAAPDGFARVEPAENSFGFYLQHLPLKAPATPVKYYDGRIKPNNGVYLAVVDIDVGKKDLQQCADAIMRLRAEYLYGRKNYDQIHFNFTNGFRADYAKWRSGYRIRVDGNQVSWYKTNSASEDYPSFRKYMERVFMYAGTLSLAKELQPVPLSELKIGDVFIQGGSPGHAVIVVDAAEEASTGKRLFMLAQSYMPAQDIQVLQNPNDSALSPWYSLEKGATLYTPEWTFAFDDLKRFE